jgi:hypothetical protein
MNGLRWFCLEAEKSFTNEKKEGCDEEALPDL